MTSTTGAPMTTATTTRRFMLTKGALSIILVQYVTGALTATYSWSVLSGKNLAGHGKFNSTTSVPAALRRVANSVSMRSAVADARLRTLTWLALDGHEHVPASELRAGDSVLLYGTTCRTVATVQQCGDTVVVDFTKSSEQQPLFRRFSIHQLCNLTKRGPQ